MPLSDETGSRQIDANEREQFMIGKQGLRSAFPRDGGLGKPLLFPIKGGSGFFPSSANTLNAIELASGR